MRRTAAVIESQAARSAQAMRRQARPANTGASLSPLKHQRIRELLPRGRVPWRSSNPSATRSRFRVRSAVQKSQFVVPAAGSTTVPSVMCGAGGRRGRQCGASEEQHVVRGKVTGHLKPRIERAARRVLPNPSVKRSAAGRPPGPVWRYAVHCRQTGPGVLPSSPAYLER
jgi:hypothetical protein